MTTQINFFWFFTFLYHMQLVYQEEQVQILPFL